MKISSVLGVLILVASVAGCSKSTGETARAIPANKEPAAVATKEGEDSKRSAVERFYDYRAKGDYAAAFDMMGQVHRALYNKEDWIVAMKGADTAAGGLKHADTQAWGPTDKITVQYGSLITDERLGVSQNPPHQIVYLFIAEQGADETAKEESRGERITDPATEMTFKGVVESISNNRPKDLLNRMEFERRMGGGSTPWHLLAGPREMTLLHFAAIQGATDSVATLIELGTPVDVLAQDDATPLFLAACAGQLETVKLLVDHGAATDRLNSLGKKPQDCAEGLGKLEVASWLKEHSKGATKSPFEPLHRLDAAAKSKYEQICDMTSKAVRTTPHHPQTIAQVNKLIDEGFFSEGDSCFVIEEGPPDSAVHQMNAAIRGERGRGKVMGSILAIAAAVGSTEIVRHAVEHGFDPSGGFYSYTTLNGQHGSGPALLLAAQNGHAEVVKLLIDKGADVNAVDSGAMRHLFDYAANPAIRAMLVDAGRAQVEKSR